jgi:hypothetical protein
MSADSRIEYLLRAAARAEREGNVRLAAILKRMAEELQPVDGALAPPLLPDS